ncbi:hypothetical protein EKK58_04860 [Candidatus Dependentiae bacterium]|nr:MAG: hypothetical protein EKK58_04860 [Candidatus Dependentiae bacterium]
MKKIPYLLSIYLLCYPYIIHSSEGDLFNSITILTQLELNEDKKMPFGFAGMKINDDMVYINHDLRIVLKTQENNKFMAITYLNCHDLNPQILRPSNTLPFENESSWYSLIYWNNRKQFFFWGPFFEKRNAVGCLTSTNIDKIGFFNHIENPLYNHIMYHYTDEAGKQYHNKCYVSYGKHGCQPLYFDTDKYFALLLATFFPSRVVWDKKIFYTEKYTRHMLEKLSRYISDTQQAFPDELKPYTNKTALALFLFGIKNHFNKAAKQTITTNLIIKIWELKQRIDNNTIEI